MEFLDPISAVSLIEDGATVGLAGGGGGLSEATLLHESIERLFLEAGRPRDLTVVHSLGIGDRKSRGLNRFAHEGMVKRVIGGHWIWSPKMQEMARDNLIEAYVMPAGVTMQLMREIAAKRPGLFTHVGLGTFVDPRLGGGKMNSAAVEDLVEFTEIDGKEYLRYLPYQITAALLKGSAADDDGNISLDEEPANVEIYALASAVHNCGGKVIFQVRRRVPRGSLSARSVRIPSAIIDAVVVDPEQRQGYDLRYDPAISGEISSEAAPPAAPAFSVRSIVARRAKRELLDGAVVNYGFGIPDEVAAIAASEGSSTRYFQTIEHGTYGGTLLTGSLFGYARNASCMIDGPSQFDFYSGGGLDIAFLGFGEVDEQGNVNVSKLGGLTVGPGGFMDIAQNAKKVVFCGAFDAKGSEIETGDGRLRIKRYGNVRKFVKRVEQITFSGQRARSAGQEIIYVTERCVFRLVEDGLQLTEIAPGVNLQSDILDQMGFRPRMIDSPNEIGSECFIR